MRQRSISSSSLIPCQGIVYRISCNIKKEGNNVISMRGKKKTVSPPLAEDFPHLESRTLEVITIFEETMPLEEVSGKRERI